MESTITTKGQVTLPKALRSALHLKTGDKVIFEELEEGGFILKPKTLDVQALKGILQYSGPIATLEDMEHAISENAGA
jgi:antitoxin PrlF